MTSTAQATTETVAGKAAFPAWPETSSGMAGPRDRGFVMRLLLEFIAVGAPAGQYRQAAARAQSTQAWEALLERAGAHGVVPLLHRNLIALGPDEIEPGIRERVEVMRRCIRLRNLVMAEALLEIRDLLADQGVSALAFKGPALAVAAYGDVAMRQFDDLDIVVRPRDRLRAARALEGYCSTFGRHGAELTEFFLCYEEALELRRGLGTLDLHWGLNPGYFDYAPAVEELFARARPVALAGGEILAPASDDALLAVCVHASRHGWSRLNWICDVAYLAARNGADESGWARLLERAARLGCRRMLLLGLYLAHWLLDASLPARVAPGISNDPNLSALARRIAVPLFDSICPGQDWTHDFAIPALTLEHGAQRWRFAIHRLMSPTLVDWAAMPLPRALFGLYYLLRPMRLMLDFARRG